MYPAVTNNLRLVIVRMIVKPSKSKSVATVKRKLKQEIVIMDGEVILSVRGEKQLKD